MLWLLPLTLTSRKNSSSAATTSTSQHPRNSITNTTIPLHSTVATTAEMKKQKFSLSLDKEHHRRQQQQQQQQQQRLRQESGGLSRRTCQRILSLFFLLLALILYGLLTQDEYFKGLFLAQDEEELLYYSTLSQNQIKGTSHDNNDANTVILPKALIDLGIYNPDTDFQNSLGIVPPFWATNPNSTATTTTTTTEDVSSHVPPLHLQSWGPCYPPHSKIEWKNESDDTRNNNNKNNNNKNNKMIKYKYRHKAHNSPPLNELESVQGGCRPGFLIIGAGKCGTSSLYHYLVGHPRVAPAYSKQIHYFKYHLNKPLGWYYSWFPTTETFLKHGSLITGEASPGYLPYPDVARKIKSLMPTPKIIVVGRNPLERIYSSYKYNYVQPTLDAMKSGKVAGIPGQRQRHYKKAKGKTTTTSRHYVQQDGNNNNNNNNKVDVEKDTNDDGDDDSYYQSHLFSLEEMVRAELTQLQACLYGFGAEATKDLWYSKHWARQEFDAREHFDMDPLIDLDEVCYGKVVNETVLRPQWAELQANNPHNKIILDKNTFLTQAMIGRSLYVLPLEWWYLQFDANDILFVCTEELSNPETIQSLALQLGLPTFDFTHVIAKGAYNVGDHRGYDIATSWEEATITSNNNNNNETADDTSNSSSSDDMSLSSLIGSSSTTTTTDIPLSEDLKQEVLEFIRPFNERLFELTGKQCNWD